MSNILMCGNEPLGLLQGNASDISFTPGGGLLSDNVQDAITELDTNKVDKETGKGLFSGSYNDLTDIPAVNKVYEENSTGNAPYRVLLSASYDDTSKDDTAKKSSKLTFNPSTGVLNQQGNLFINRKDGTTSAQGYSDLYIGNAAATGSAENSKGRIILYANSKYYTILNAKDGMSNYRSVDFPDASGTVLLDSTLTIVNIDSSNFNYDSSNKYFYSKQAVNNYTSKDVLGVLEVLPSSYGATILTGYIGGNNIICVNGWIPGSAQPLSNSVTFVVKLLCKN